MDSVYFGKENSLYQAQGSEPDPGERKPREYYFPDENTTKMDIIAFISALLISSLLDIIIFGVVYPFLIYYFGQTNPIFKLISVNVFLIADIIIIYVFLFLIIYGLIHNIGRGKVFVNDNGTFYFIKMNVRVKTHKRPKFAKIDYANRKIHYKYDKYIFKANKLIDNNSFKVYKVLTGCRESNDLHDEGLYFSGYNEKKVRDEDFKIPSNYIKYDPTANYYKNKIGYTLTFWIIKLAFYGAVFLWLVSIGRNRLTTFENYFDDYRDSKIELLEPLGLIYTENETYYNHTYEYLEFIDETDDLRNSVRIYFYITEDGRIEDNSIDIFYDFYYDYDLDQIHGIIDALCDIELPEPDAIEDTVDKYLEKENGTKTYNISTEEVYFTVNVMESYWADFRIFVYISDYSNTFHLF